MEDVQFDWRRWASFSGLEAHALLAAREAVFVVEQQCPYQDADAHDAFAWHLVASCGPVIAAYLRVIDPGRQHPEPRIGRVLTTRQFRGTGLGRRLVATGIARTRAQFPGCGIRISAQLYLRRFYENFGFHPVSAEYLEDGIAHLDMVLPPERAPAGE